MKLTIQKEGSSNLFTLDVNSEDLLLKSFNYFATQVGEDLINLTFVFKGNILTTAQTVLGAGLSNGDTITALCNITDWTLKSEKRAIHTIIQTLQTETDAQKIKESIANLTKYLVAGDLQGRLNFFAKQKGVFALTNLLKSCDIEVILITFQFFIELLWDYRQYVLEANAMPIFIEKLISSNSLLVKQYALKCLEYVVVDNERACTDIANIPEVIPTIVDFLKTLNTDLLEVVVDLMYALSISPNCAVKIMLHGGIELLLNMLDSTNTRILTSTLGALSGLNHTKTVRNLISQLLNNKCLAVKQLVNLCSNDDIGIAFNAASTIAFLLLNKENFTPLMHYKALTKLSQFCSRSDIFSKFNYLISELQLKSFLALLDSEYEEVHCVFMVVMARFSSSDREISYGKEGKLIQFMNEHLLPQFRYFAFRYNTRISELAAIALINLNDYQYLNLKSLQIFLTSIGIKETKKLLPLFEKNCLDLNVLFDLELDQNTILQSLTIIGIQEGIKLRILSALKGIKAQFEKAKSELPILAAQYSAQGAEDSFEEKNKLGAENSKQIFISYSWANKQSVKQLKNNLEKSSLTCWMDENSIMGGGQLFEKIDDGVSECKVFLACISDQYGSSENCRREMRLATDRRKLIIPVLIATCDPYPPRGDMGPLLAGKLYIDISGEEKFKKNLEQLITTIKQSL